MGPDWEQVIQKISRGHYLPLLLVYADHDTVPPTQSHEQSTRVTVRDFEPSNTGRVQSRFSANGKGMLSLKINKLYCVNARMMNVVHSSIAYMITSFI